MLKFEYFRKKQKKTDRGGVEGGETEDAVAAAGVAAVGALAAGEVGRAGVGAAPRDAAHGERGAAPRALQPVRGAPQPPVDAAPRAQLRLGLRHVRAQTPHAAPA